MIELQNVTKMYGEVIGVNDINLKLEPGTYGLLGPNGSGKTTLINLILGQLKPTIGHVKLFDCNPWRQSHLLRRIGLCPTNDVSYPRVTARTWVTYLTQLHGFSKSEASDRALAALEQVKMTYAMDRPMRNYSLGMRQRTKLAQAIAHDPDLLILDEPFNGLDPVGRFEMISFLREWGTRGKSLVLASHILHEVEAIRPAFLLISSGRLLASGSQQEVRRILSITPNKLMISTDNPKLLAKEIIANCDVASLEIQDDPPVLTLDTQAPIEVYEAIPGIVRRTGVKVHELKSVDDSLKTLFSTLMKIHRGENKKGILI